LQCAFGTQLTPARLLSASAVSCQAPMVGNDISRVDLRVTSNGQDFSQPLAFEYQGK